MFKSAGFLASMGAEASTGQFEIMVAQVALMGIAIGFKKLHQKVSNKRENKREDQSAQEMAREQARIDAEQYAITQAELERQRQEQEAQDRREQERMDREAEQQRMRDIAMQQTTINNQRLAENASDMQRIDNVVDNQLGRLEIQRMQRENQLGINAQVQGYPGQSDLPFIARLIFPPSMLQEDREPDEEWRLYGDEDVPDDENYSYPGPDGPPGPGPNGGGGYPNGGGDDQGTGFNGAGRRIGGNRQYAQRNPYYDIIKALADQIQKQRNDEKASVEDVYAEPFREPLGGNPATWTPTSNQSEIVPDSSTDKLDKMPGEGGSGTLKPTAITTETTKQAAYDNIHIIQEEQEAILAAQGEAQIVAEQQAAALYNIENMLPQLVKDQVMFSGDDIFSLSIIRF